MHDGIFMYWYLYIYYLFAFQILLLPLANVFKNYLQLFTFYIKRVCVCVEGCWNTFVYTWLTMEVYI